MRYHQWDFKLHSCAGTHSSTLLKLLQLQVTWPFMRKNYLVNWLPFNRCRWCCFWRMQEACGRAQTYCMVHFYPVIAFSSYSWSFEVVTFLRAFWRAFTQLLVQGTYNFSEKLKFTEVCFVLKVFFLTWITSEYCEYCEHFGNLNHQTLLFHV